MKCFVFSDRRNMKKSLLSTWLGASEEGDFGADPCVAGPDTGLLSFALLLLSGDFLSY